MTRNVMTVLVALVLFSLALTEPAHARPRKKKDRKAPEVTEEVRDALFEDDVGVVKKYLEAGGNPDALTGESTLLIAACNNGSLECMKLLLDKGADIDLARPDGETPLLRAAGSLYRAGLDSVKLLVERGADVNKTYPKGTSPLMKVTAPPGEHYQDTYLEALEYLISKGADVNARLESGQSVLDLVKEDKNERFIEVLQKAGAR